MSAEGPKFSQPYGWNRVLNGALAPQEWVVVRGTPPAMLNDFLRTAQQEQGMPEDRQAQIGEAPPAAKPLQLG